MTPYFIVYGFFGVSLRESELLPNRWEVLRLTLSLRLDGQGIYCCCEKAYLFVYNWVVYLSP